MAGKKFLEFLNSRIIPSQFTVGLDDGVPESFDVFDGYFGEELPLPAVPPAGKSTYPPWLV